jgi:hypothetical protein
MHTNQAATGQRRREVVRQDRARAHRMHAGTGEPTILARTYVAGGEHVTV